MRMKIRKMLALLMAVCVLLAVTPGTPSAYAAGSTKVLSSSAFHSFIVAYDENTRELSLEGNGKVPALSDETATPWSDYSTQITTLSIGEGITSIGSGAFAGLVNLDTVIFPSTIKFIETDAFVGCNNVTNIIFPGSMSYLEGLLSENSVRELLRSLNGESTRTTTNGRVRASESTKPRLVGNGNNTSGRGYNRGWDWDSGDARDYHPNDQKQTKTPASEKTVTPAKETPKPEKETPKPIQDYEKKDAQGRTTESRKTNKDGTVEVTTYSYDDEKGITESNTEILDKDGKVIGNTSNRTETSTDENGNTTKTETNTSVSNGKTKTTQTSVTTDKDNRIVAETTEVNRNGIVESNEKTYTYDETGKLTTTTETSTDRDKNTVTETVNYSYDAEGKETKAGTVVSKDANDQVTQYETYTTQPAGANIKTEGQVFSDAKGTVQLGNYTINEEAGENGGKVVRYEYNGTLADDNRHVSEIKNYNSDGTYDSGTRTWSKQGEEGNVNIDEQGRITSGTIENKQDNTKDVIQSIVYDDEGTSTKTGTYTKGETGVYQENYKEVVSADGLSTHRSGELTEKDKEGVTKNYTFVRNVDKESDGSYSTLDTKTDTETKITKGEGRTYDSDNTWKTLETIWADGDGNESSTSSRVKIVERGEGRVSH